MRDTIYFFGGVSFFFIFFSPSFSFSLFFFLHLFLFFLILYLFLLFSLFFFSLSYSLFSWFFSSFSFFLIFADKAKKALVRSRDSRTATTGFMFAFDVVTVTRREEETCWNCGFLFRHFILIVFPPFLFPFQWVFTPHVVDRTEFDSDFLNTSVSNLIPFFFYPKKRLSDTPQKKKQEYKFRNLPFPRNGFRSQLTSGPVEFESLCLAGLRLPVSVRGRGSA